MIKTYETGAKFVPFSLNFKILIHNIARSDVTRVIQTFGAGHMPCVGWVVSTSSGSANICCRGTCGKTARVALCFFSETTEFRVAECPDHATKVHKKRWHHQKHERIRLNNRLRHHIRHPCRTRKNGFYKYINSYANKLRGDWAECPRITVAFSPVYLRSWASQLLLPYYDSSLFRTLQ